MAVKNLKANPNKLVIFMRGDGLASRMKSTLFSILLARRLGIPLLILWPNCVGHRRCSFDSIFDARYYDYLELDEVGYRLFDKQKFDQKRARGYLLRHFDRIHFQPMKANLVVSPLNRKWFRKMLLKPVGVSSVLSNRDSLVGPILYVRKSNLDGKLGNIRNLLRFNLQLAATARIYHLKHLNSGGFIGLHIRRGDLLGDLRGTEAAPITQLEVRGVGKKVHGRIRGLDLYWSKLSKLDSKLLVFLCTDDPIVEAYFRERLGSRLVKYPVVHYEDDDPLSVSEALVDWLLLSRSSWLICDSNSNFSGMVIRYGQIPKGRIIRV